MIDRDRHLRVLQRNALSLAEWYVLSLIGMWPMPSDKVVQFAASHGEGDPRGGVSRSDCARALKSCIDKRNLRVVDSRYRSRLKSLVPTTSLGPIYGYPNLGDIDFTVSGARLFKRVNRQLYGRQSAPSTMFEQVSTNAKRLFFPYKNDALQVMASLGKTTSSAHRVKIRRIGSWCVYWWRRYRTGFCIIVSNTKGKRKC